MKEKHEGEDGEQDAPAAVAAMSLALRGLKMSRVLYIMSGTTACPPSSICDCTSHKRGVGGGVLAEGCWQRGGSRGVLAEGWWQRGVGKACIRTAA